MTYSSISDLNFAIQILKLASNKIPDESYAKLRVTASTSRVIFDLEEIIKSLKNEQLLEKEKAKDIEGKI